MLNKSRHEGTIAKCDVDVGRSCAKLAAKPQDPRILITHIPLARPESASCGPLRERGRILKGAGIGYQNLLGSETTRFLLNNVKPSVIYRWVQRDYRK